MLPFLRERHEGGMSGPVEETIHRDPDEFDILDAVAHDMMDAIHSKDKRLLKQVLEALIEHVMTIDEIQDEEDE